MEGKETLLGKTPAELKETVLRLGLPAFTAKQLALWIYGRGADSFDGMTDISKAGREKLSQECEVGHVRPSEVFKSSDGTASPIKPRITS